MVYLVIDAIDGMKINGFKVNHRGTGNALLRVCYCAEIYDARQLWEYSLATDSLCKYNNID